MKFFRSVGPDLFLVLLFGTVAFFFHAYLIQFFSPLQTKVEIDLSLTHLPLYTFFSLFRGTLAYILSFLFTIVFGYWAAKDKLASRVLIPLLDLGQSIPILGFLPGVVLFLISVFPKSNMGLEIAAILLMFTGQVWNMVFGVYFSIRTIPTEKLECAEIYRLSGIQKAAWLEYPFASLSLVWNSIMSMAGGWFFLMVNEAFTLGNRDYRIPGLGSYMSVAAENGDGFSMTAAIFAMIALIVFLDQFLWRPLVVWSQKFRLEGTITATSTWFTNVLKYSVLTEFLRRFSERVSDWYLRAISHFSPSKGLQVVLVFWMSRLCLIALVLLVVLGLIHIVPYVYGFEMSKWMELVLNALLTLTRVFTSMVISLCIGLPIGLAIGLSEKWSRILEPVIQVGASFPATLLFPALIILLKILGIPLGIGSIVLMCMGTFWYVLYNVIAGAKALPMDLKETAATFHFSRSMRFFKLYLPGIFPQLITGLRTAAGGAWNASIVAEYVNYHGSIWTTRGIGSTISLAAQTGDIALLTTSVLVMMGLVVALNYGIWQRVYQYSEERFAINV